MPLWQNLGPYIYIYVAVSPFGGGGLILSFTPQQGAEKVLGGTSIGGMIE